MAVIDTIPTSDVTLPKFIADRRHLNGKLDASWLRCPDGRGTSLTWRLFTPVSYAMTALQLEALRDGVAIPAGNSNAIDTTGRYRTYERQVALFYERYTLDVSKAKTPYVTRFYEGKTWYLKKGMAMAATPGTSNHGFGLADDIAEDPDSDDSTPVVSIDNATLLWMRDNAPKHGFGLDTRSEPWHWHWFMPTNPNTLTQRTVDVLAGAGVTIPSLAAFGFTVPDPTTVPPPTPPSSSTYTVVAGDSWWKIAQTLGVPMDALIAANPPATSSTVIHPGQVLNVPGAAPAPPPPPPAKWYPGEPQTADAWVAYGATLPTPPPTLKWGDVSDNTTWWQAVFAAMPRLPADGGQPIFDPNLIAYDRIGQGPPTRGLYGDASRAACVYWQSKNGLAADGVYGAQTQGKVKSARGM